jgi:hypothetical protein
MNLKRIIKKILREEIEIPITLRRRLRNLDDELDIVLGTFSDRISMCDFKDENKFLEYIIETAIENTYWTYFGNIDVNSELWTQLYRGMLIYYESRFGEKIKYKYIDGCVKSSINEDIDSLPLFVKRRYSEIKNLLKLALINTFPCESYDFIHYKTIVLSNIYARYLTNHTYDESTQIVEIVKDYYMDEIQEYYDKEMKKC